MGRSRGNFHSDEDPTQRSRRKKNASIGENLESSAAGQATSEGKRDYHCNYCNKDITGKVRIKCCMCPDFDLCIECFSVGAEVTSHKSNHSYRVMDNLSFPLICPDWNADDEILLLEATEMYGLGNWAEVAEHVGTKSKEQCIEHYTNVYLNSPYFPLPDMSHVVGKNRKELLAMAKGHGEDKKGFPTLGDHNVKEESPFSPSRIKVEDTHKGGSSGHVMSRINSDVESGLRSSGADLPQFPTRGQTLTFAESKMRNLPLVPLVIAVLVAALVSPSSAEIRTLTISSDNRPMILFEKFGFTHTGHVSIQVSHVSVTSKHPDNDPSRFGFFLLSEESLLQVLVEIQQNPQLCVLDSRYITHLFNFKELSPPPQASFSHSYPVSAPNEYSLFFANCVPETTVSMIVRTEVYNLDPDGSHDYLSAGLTNLPSLFSVFFLAYLVFVGFWVYLCYTNKRSVHRIHLLMGGLLLMKALNLISAAEDKHYVKVTGTAHGWDVLFYIFQFLRVILLFTVIVLIGTGWSFLKPFLQEKEKKVLMIVIPLQVLANVASIVIGETGPFIKDWVTWNQIFLLVDIICCCAIIFPIVWSIRSLRETSKTDGKAARNLAKLTLFRQFYVVVIGYLYFTRIVVFALKTIAAYKYQWVSNAAEETVSLAFYMVMFYMFRPVERNEYFILDEEEEEAAEVALRDEEFEL